MHQRVCYCPSMRTLGWVRQYCPHVTIASQNVTDVSDEFVGWVYGLRVDGQTVWQSPITSLFMSVVSIGSSTHLYWQWCSVPVTASPPPLPFRSSAIAPSLRRDLPLLVYKQTDWNVCIKQLMFICDFIAVQKLSTTSQLNFVPFHLLLGRWVLLRSIPPPLRCVAWLDG